MSKKYRIAAIGFAHMHIQENLETFAACGDRVEFVACADLPPLVPTLSQERGTRGSLQRWAVEKLGFKPYDDVQTLLSENEIDIAVVCAENAFHPEVCETLLRRGIHVVLEKPMAVELRGALRMARAAREGGARIITNWPSAWWPSVRQAKKLCDAGEIGRIFKFTYRNSDSMGPFSYGQTLTDAEKGREWWHQQKPGGGSLLDYCSYGSSLSCWFLGANPVGAYGLKANFNAPYGSAEDYATITVRFPEAVAILEGSWSTVNSGVTNGPLVFGLEGTLVTHADRVEIFRQRHSLVPDAVIEPEPLPLGRETLGKEVLHHLDTGEPLFELLDLPLNLSAMAVLDAGARSAATGRLEMAGDGVWCVGDE